MDRILVLPGDGIGPSIMESAVKVIGAACSDVEIVHGDIGFSAYEVSGHHLPYETLDLAGECDNILCGPVRTTRDDRGSERDPVETLKIQLDLYAMTRTFRTLAPDLGPEGMEVTLWATNTDLGQDVVETRDMDGITLTKYSRSSSYSRMMGKALSDMEMSGKRRVACIGRGDLFPESSGLFRESFDSLFDDGIYGITHMDVPEWSSRVVREPMSNDYIVCADMYSHVAAGILSGLTGGNHITPVGFVGDSSTLYLPGNMHTFEDIPPEYVNPTSAILAGASALFNMNRRAEAESIVEAVRDAYMAGKRTPDMGGDLTGSGFTDLIVGSI
ncbi:MAG: hypothetical protein IJ026_04315 [Candidatus Methanomethylophilaceae archaeon]|nr:hypothetical protein [Candidatus Methanomethylophilaceae archaeon]